MDIKNSRERCGRVDSVSLDFFIDGFVCSRSIVPVRTGVGGFLQGDTIRRRSVVDRFGARHDDAGLQGQRIVQSSFVGHLKRVHGYDQDDGKGNADADACGRHVCFVFESRCFVRCAGKVGIQKNFKFGIFVVRLSFVSIY